MSSDTQAQRLAGIRERVVKFLISYGEYEPYLRSLNGKKEIEKLAAFADSERERVLLEAAKAVCRRCDPVYGIRINRTFAPAKRNEEYGQWEHAADGDAQNLFECHAGPIHDLRSKGESR